MAHTKQNDLLIGCLLNHESSATLSLGNCLH